MSTLHSVRRAHRFALAGLSLGFFVWILNAHSPFAGTAVLEYTAGALHGQITRLHPLDRVRLASIQDGQSIAENLIEDPIYFEIKTAVDFRLVDFEFLYRNQSRAPFRVGVRRAAGYGSFDPVAIQNVGSSGIWDAGSAHLDLSGIQRERNRYFFILSFPGVAYEHPEYGDIQISSFRATLRRDVISFNDLLTFLRSIVL